MILCLMINTVWYISCWYSTISVMSLCTLFDMYSISTILTLTVLHFCTWWKSFRAWALLFIPCSISVHYDDTVMKSQVFLCSFMEESYILLGDLLVFSFCLPFLRKTGVTSTIAAHSISTFRLAWSRCCRYVRCCCFDCGRRCCCLLPTLRAPPFLRYITVPAAPTVAVLRILRTAACVRGISLDICIHFLLVLCKSVQYYSDVPEQTVIVSSISIIFSELWLHRNRGSLQLTHERSL